MLKKIKRIIKHWWQRRVRGWDDSELYSLDYTLAKYLVPRLKRFREVTCSFPVELESIEQWHQELDVMIETFEFLANKDRWLYYDKEKWDQIQDGLDLFAKRYLDIWW